MKIYDWGLISYNKATNKQLELVEKIAKNDAEECLIVCSHPPIVTLGRASTDSDVSTWAGETQVVSRGGKATYHGPSQIIVYPILDLQKRNKDLHQHMRKLEISLIQCLSEYGIEATGNIPDKTGVWLENKKIASIGIAAKQWISYHGIAMNFLKDDKAFTGISPCGFSQDTMISLEEVLKPLPSIETFKQTWLHFLKQELSI